MKNQITSRSYGDTYKKLKAALKSGKRSSSKAAKAPPPICFEENKAAAQGGLPWLTDSLCGGQSV